MPGQEDEAARRRHQESPLCEQLLESCCAGIQSLWSSESSPDSALPASCRDQPPRSQVGDSPKAREIGPAESETSLREPVPSRNGHKKTYLLQLLRDQGVEEDWSLEIPLTSERIRMACQDQIVRHVQSHITHQVEDFLNILQ